MNLALRKTFESQISLTRDFDFEDLIKEILLIRHGTEGFIPTRPKKDRGCDGIIVTSNTIIACYGPVAYDEKKYSKKVKEDYEEYKTHWQIRYPNWQFVFNGKLGPEAINVVSDLHTGATPWGLDSIMNIIVNEFNGTQRRQIARFLGIPDSQISQDYLAEILENLLQKTQVDPNEIYKYRQANLVDVENKIKLNYELADVEIALQEYVDMIDEIFETGRLFKAFSDDEQSRIKTRVRNDYKNANGRFKERIKIIADNYLLQYSSINDDIYRHNVIAVMLYLFEQCLIGTTGK